MQKLALKDFLDYEYLSAVSVSPDKKHVAFIKTNCNMEQNNYTSCIYVLNVATKEVKQLTSYGEEKKFIWFDNNSLLFSGLRDKHLKDRNSAGEPWTAFYRISVSGGEATEYMRVPMKVIDYTKITDKIFGLTCVYKNASPNPHDYEGAEREAVLKQLKEEQDYIVADEIPFRHNGPGHHNSIRSRLYTFNKDTGDLDAVTDQWQNTEFISSNNPDELMYTAMHFHKEERMGLKTGIYLYNLKTKSSKELVNESKYRIRYCDYMGDKILFAASDMKTWGPNENPHFYTVTADGKEEMVAENHISACNSVGSDCRFGGGADYQNSGGEIYFTSTQGGNALIMKLDKNGKTESLSVPNGTVDCFAVADNKIYFVGMKGNKLQELYLLENGVETQLTCFNEWVQNERTLSTPESFTFDSEGYKIEGWVMKPIGFEKGKKYPAILDIHGGHKCAYGSNFYHEMQLWANEGYFVFYCNPRGSDGGGNYFAEIIDKYGEIDYVDIMKFTDEVIARNPEIDVDRIAVTGGSYGGFMTNWIIGHTDRFKCACSQRSISNYISEFGTADTGYYFPLKQFVGSNIWEHNDRYWFHSPLKYANNCKTPTLFIHSEEDYRCPLQEGIQMFTALKFNGVEARICIFKGENHELSRSGKPTHRVRRLTEITDWFNSHLK